MGKNDPGTDAKADQEVALDIQVAGGCAPGAKIVVYFAPNTEAGTIDAYTTAIHDTTNNPSVISISWGGSEDAWAAMTRTAVEQVFGDAAMLGVTICVASGDHGASDLLVPDGLAHVDFCLGSPCAGMRWNPPRGRPGRRFGIRLERRPWLGFGRRHQRSIRRSVLPSWRFDSTAVNRAGTGLEFPMLRATLTRRLVTR